MAGARGNWNSNFGFIMAAVGSAVGLGNLVRFPKELANNGGAAFLFVYLILLLLVGLPAILGEMSLGKISEMSPVNAFRKLGEGAGKKWAVLGFAGMISATLVMFYYAVMTGWTLRFFFAAFTGGWYDAPTEYFDSVAYGPGAILWLAIVAVIVIYIVSRGISGGIEKVTSIIMPALFGIIILMVVYALFQGGMGAGYTRIFKPDFAALTPQNISAATGQVFFSLSLGQGAMLTYASYMEKKQSVTVNGSIIAAADTGVAILAAMMIFPTLAFTGLLTEYADAGTFGMAFEAMPSAFVSMGGIGRFLGAIFFLGLFFAALSSAISLLEVPVSVLVDNLGIPRWKSAVIMGGTVYTLAVLSAVNEYWFELFDLVAVNVFIVLGVAAATFFAGWVAKGVAKELDTGLKSRIGMYLVWMMRTITPVLILITFFFGGLWGQGTEGGSYEFFSSGYDGDHNGEAGFHKLYRIFLEAIGQWEHE